MAGFYSAVDNWRPEKQILGAETDQSAPLTGPLQNRRKSDWSATAPVRANLTPLTGPLQHRSYNHSPISLTSEAQTQFDALPEQFPNFIAAPDRFAVQPLPKAA